MRRKAREGDRVQNGSRGALINTSVHHSDSVFGTIHGWGFEPRKARAKAKGIGFQPRRRGGIAEKEEAGRIGMWAAEEGEKNRIAAAEARRARRTAGEGSTEYRKGGRDGRPPEDEPGGLSPRPLPAGGSHGNRVRPSDRVRPVG